MAGSRYAYVRSFELADPCLPSTYLVVRIDGKAFHAFTAHYAFSKPNDERALRVMNDAARGTMASSQLGGECVLAFGQSDEFSFVLSPKTTLFGRRKAKLTTTIVSLFTASYMFNWSKHFPERPLEEDHLPSFDGRIVEYPNLSELQDYLRWRQVDTHINNLYNTAFWALVLKEGKTTTEANKELAPTNSALKNELLFSRFGINYNSEPAIFRKGSILIWEKYLVDLDGKELPVGGPQEAPDAGAGDKKARQRKRVVIRHEDLISSEWWDKEGPGGKVFAAT